MKKIIFFLVMMCAGLICTHAQNVNIENLKGEKILFSDLIKGDKPVIVSFWATWCKPCLMEMDALKEIKEEWEGKIRIVSISIDDSRSKNKVPSFVKGRNYPFEIYMDSNQELYKKLNVLNVPFLFIFSNGKQVYKHSGYSPGDEEYLLEEAMKYVK
ncbi:TlpA family protein disulfide reductase [Porphyromonas cangingivalis]|uniref:Thiol-disulfide isomerase or thioredoxin n=1 Tax=Porphyromonas cangingivalis TaxID=36874 RepID=A0A1T4LSK1_PORCN|nr:TlpA disulfide reductase family protein [Porphyromonas cangingivalis]SJZ57596.1 Thiol-disulfide isomerase or thioredoxin [Porphyromonas cangingivalis]SPY34410.1 Thioredoxin [Porphyromonas cangingivalis]VEJ02029.1 Thioredoxin [Porphyromonas cangingivalis]